MRAVVFVTEFTPKGTDRSSQEYQNPLLVLSGEEYSAIMFSDPYDRICSALRGNQAPIVAEILGANSSCTVIRHPPNQPRGRTTPRRDDLTPTCQLFFCYN
ncbi:MAG TPA: hypothetical protein VLG39_01315 [Nitrospirota bacterium]|nr:hypothetical protein [Nitrospirota bacterium]